MPCAELAPDAAHPAGFFEPAGGVEPHRRGLRPGNYPDHLAKARALGLNDQQCEQRPADPFAAAIVLDIDAVLAREAIRAILEDNPEIEVVGEAADGKEGVRKTYELKPNVITMDLRMPLMSGVEAIKEIMEKMPTPIIVVSSADKRVIINALSIGAMDFVLISDNMEEMAKDLADKNTSELTDLKLSTP